MGTELVLKEYNATIHEVLGGRQAVVRFGNNYGASIIDHFGSHGVELAVIHFYSRHPDDFDLVYDTPVTSDVIGYLNEDSLRAALVSIAALPAR